MKVYIQKLRPKMYLKSLHEWVKTQAAARPFTDSGEAINFCVESGLKDVQLVLSSGDPEYDILIRPFGPWSPKPEQPASRKSKKLLAEHHKRRIEQEVLLVRLDLALAERKDATKRFAFKRKQIAPDSAPENGE